MMQLNGMRVMCNVFVVMHRVLRLGSAFILHTTVGEDVCNNSKNVKSHVFFGF